MSSITTSDGVSRGKLKISLPARQCSACRDLKKDLKKIHVVMFSLNVIFEEFVTRGLRLRLS